MAPHSSSTTKLEFLNLIIRNANIFLKQCFKFPTNIDVCTSHRKKWRKGVLTQTNIVHTNSRKLVRMRDTKFIEHPRQCQFWSKAGIALTAFHFNVIDPESERTFPFMCSSSKTKI